MANVLFTVLTWFGLQPVLHYTPLTNNLFAADFSALIAADKSTENVVYSPALVHMSLALMLMGAGDHTETELKNVLRLGKEDKGDLAVKYGFFLNETLKTQTKGPQLLVANRIFVNNNLNILKKFNEIASFYFKCEAENIDFGQALEASEKINDWIEWQTQHKIKNFIQPKMLSSDTSVVVVNAIYFKATWANALGTFSIKQNDFHISTSEKKKVDNLFTNAYLRYAEIPKLKAKVLELPYQHSNISMWIFLPDEIDGLQNLEKNLSEMDFKNISAAMRVENVDVLLPKFQIESEIDLKEPLKKMGCTSLFDVANLSNMLDTIYAQEISDVKQKTIINCNEQGAEAVSILAFQLVFKSFPIPKKYFTADHPFVFVIRSETMVYFYGHVARP